MIWGRTVSERQCRFDELMGDILEMDYMYFKPLVDSISDMNVGNDWFLVANDFASYLDCQVLPFCFHTAARFRTCSCTSHSEF